jgi:hypothetical protein
MIRASLRYVSYSERKPVVAALRPITHRAPMWKQGERSRLEQRVIEGSADLSMG